MIFPSQQKFKADKKTSLMTRSKKRDGDAEEGMSDLQSVVTRLSTPQSSGDLNAVDVSVEVDGARFSWLQYTIQVMSMHHLLGARR